MRAEEGLLVVQRFHPMLFRQGALHGPKLIMEYQRGVISDDNLEDAWAVAFKGIASDEKIHEVKYPCGVCNRKLISTDFATCFRGVALPARNRKRRSLT